MEAIKGITGWCIFDLNDFDGCILVSVGWEPARWPDKKLPGGKTIKKNGILHLSHGNNKQLVIDKELKKKLIKAFKT